MLTGVDEGAVDTSAEPLLTQAAYARRHGVSRQAINRYVRDGIIPSHGARRLIAPGEADGCWVPRGDAGQPQCRAVLRRPAGPPTKHHTANRAADGAWEVLEWRVWVPAAAARLAAALAVAVDQVHPLLEALVETQLEAFGLCADDVQEQLAAWRAEPEWHTLAENRAARIAEIVRAVAVVPPRPRGTARAGQDGGRRARGGQRGAVRTASSSRSAPASALSSDGAATVRPGWRRARSAA